MDVGNTINGLFIDYVRGGDAAIARDRIFNKVETGGYGLIDVNNLNIAIKAAWIGRWSKENEYMDYSGYLAIGREGVDLEKIQINVVNGYPVLNDILIKWNMFLQYYYKSNRNWLRAKLFGNTSLIGDIRVQGEEVKWNNVFGNAIYEAIQGRGNEIKVSDMVDENLHVLDYVQVNRKLGVNINFIAYFRLRTAISGIIEQYRQYGEMGEDIAISRLVLSTKKGSKKYREYIDGKKSYVYRTYKTHQIPAVVTLWQHEVESEDEKLVRVQLSLWGITQYRAEFKDFLFRLIHGKLHLNNTVAHYDAVEPCCTFCKLVKEREMREQGIRIGGLDYNYEISRLAPETVLHLFFVCPWTNNIVKEFFNVQFRVRDIDYSLYTRGKIELGIEKTQIKLSILHFVKFYIYSCRRMKKLPSLAALNFEYSIFVDTLKTIRGFRPYCRNIGNIFNEL